MNQENDAQMDQIQQENFLNRPSHKHQFLIIALIFLVLVIAAVFFVRRSTNPIAGTWTAIVAISGEDTIPIVTDSYLDINQDWSFHMYLDADTQMEGQIKRYEGDLALDELGTPYVYTLEGIDAGYLFHQDDKLYQYIVGNDILIQFSK